MIVVIILKLSLYYLLFCASPVDVFMITYKCDIFEVKASLGCQSVASMVLFTLLLFSVKEDTCVGRKSKICFIVFSIVAGNLKTNSMSLICFVGVLEVAAFVKLILDHSNACLDWSYSFFISWKLLLCKPRFRAYFFRRLLVLWSSTILIFWMNLVNRKVLTFFDRNLGEEQSQGDLDQNSEQSVHCQRHSQPNIYESVEQNSRVVTSNNEELREASFQLPSNSNDPPTYENWAFHVKT